MRNIPNDVQYTKQKQIMANFVYFLKLFVCMHKIDNTNLYHIIFYDQIR